MPHFHYSERSGNCKTVKLSRNVTVPPVLRSCSTVGGELGTSPCGLRAWRLLSVTVTLLTRRKHPLWKGTKLHCPLIPIPEISTRLRFLSVKRWSQSHQKNTVLGSGGIASSYARRLPPRWSLLRTPPLSRHTHRAEEASLHPGMYVQLDSNSTQSSARARDYQCREPTALISPYICA